LNQRLEKEIAAIPRRSDFSLALRFTHWAKAEPVFVLVDVVEKAFDEGCAAGGGDEGKN